MRSVNHEARISDTDAKIDALKAKAESSCISILNNRINIGYHNDCQYNRKYGIRWFSLMFVKFFYIQFRKSNTTQRNLLTIF